MIRHPASPDIGKAHRKLTDAEGREDDKVEGKRQGMAAVDCTMKHVNSISQGKCIGKRFQEQGDFVDGEKEAAEKNNGKTEKIGNGLYLRTA